MAGAGYKLFNTGDVLTAQQVNEYLMQQTVMVFASAAARTTALSGVLAEGMVSYLQDTNVVEIYTGASWVSLDDPNAIQNSLLTTTGDTIYASGASTPARLGIGTAGQVLTVSGGVPAWTTISSGGMTLISETVASGASSLSFSSISGSYKQLVMVWSGIQNSSTATTFAVRFNNDSGSNYSFGYLRTIGGTVNTLGQSTTDCSNLKFNQNGSSTTLFEQSVGQLVIDNYASTTKNKTYTWQNWFLRVSDSQWLTELTQGTYVSTSAITSIDIVRTTGAGTFSNTGNTTIRLYGVS